MNKTIQANELRIGNYFLNADDNIERVYEICEDAVNGFKSKLRGGSGVELTPEILEKAGFSYILELSAATGKVITYKVWRKGLLIFNEIQNAWWLDGRKIDKQPNYLHQLQNLYFVHHGEELTISLT